jgi:hypothetical protein
MLATLPQVLEMPVTPEVTLDSLAIAFDLWWATPCPSFESVSPSPSRLCHAAVALKSHGATG